jgi:hypothetical protein
LDHFVFGLMKVHGCLMYRNHEGGVNSELASEFLLKNRRYLDQI